MSRSCLRFILITIVVTLTACKPIWYKPPDTPEVMWQSRFEGLVKLDNWAIKGRTAITQDKEGWNAGIRWLQQKDMYQISLVGPFSQCGVVLDGTAQKVVLTMACGDRAEAATPEALLKDNMNLQLPVSALQDWVRGLPYNKLSSDMMELDPEGRITYLKQQDWEIEFLRYTPFETYDMPAKIFIRHPNLNLRLIIADWESVE